MRSILFLQSEEPDPYTFYKRMRCESPVFRDEANNITGIYSYEFCKTVLHHSSAWIPTVNNDGLNEHALIIANRLARLRNPPGHAAARQAAMAIFQRIKPVPASVIVSDGMDWVEAVCKRIPLLTLLEGLDFNEDDCEILVAKIGYFVKIMQPVKTTSQISEINETATVIYQLIEKYILYAPLPGKVSERELYISNLAGLMIQTYDACRGLLSNAMLQLLRYPTKDITGLKKLVTETLRYDPPVQNTRRIATADINLGNYKINKGEILLIVLASANRDEHHFENADVFDINRHNNTDSLSFGAGPHACLAADFAIRVATDALLSFSKQFPNAKLLSTDIEYEPVVNARLPKNLILIK